MISTGLGLAVVTAITGFGVVQSSQATPPVLDTDLVAPAVTTGESSFYSESQVDQVWAEVTAAFPAGLPAGWEFSKTAPEFFHPDDGKESYFEAGLVNQIAARYWRCAWLDVSINSVSTSAVSQAVSALAGYENLPAVADHVDVATYLDQMSELGRRTGVPSDRAEFDLECGAYKK